VNSDDTSERSDSQPCSASFHRPVETPSSPGEETR
jgi:hypothetical protein